VTGLQALAHTVIFVVLWTLKYGEQDILYNVDLSRGLGVI